MDEQDIPAASAGTPNGRSPSGATSPGTTAADTTGSTGTTGTTDTTDTTDTTPAPFRAAHDDRDQTQVPGQSPGSTASPVPSPGDVRGVTLPAVAAGQGASPETGIHQGEKAPGSDASIASPGAYVALAPPGHPDGEVDTRAR